MLSVVPSLDELARNPTSAAQLPRDVITALMAQCAALQVALAARLASAPSALTPAATQDRTLDANEIAKELGVKRRWVFRHADQLPFVAFLGIRSSVRKLICATGARDKRFNLGGAYGMVTPMERKRGGKILSRVTIRLPDGLVQRAKLSAHRTSGASEDHGGGAGGVPQSSQR